MSNYNGWNRLNDLYTRGVERIMYYFTKIIKPDPGAQILNIEDIQRSKETAFIMGSGYSINSISEQEWSYFRKIGDIFGFNYFFKGKFVPITFHIVREMGKFSSILKSKRICECYCKEMLNNPYYKNTIFFVLYDNKTPATTFWSVFFLKLFKRKSICFYKNSHNRVAMSPPANDIGGISHCGATLFDVTNIAYLLGYKEIVLVGVDLYDRRYFWLEENESRQEDLKRGASYNNIHNTAKVVLRGMNIWKEYLEKNGVKIYVYNPRSLLHGILPLYKFEKNIEENM